MLLPLVAWLWPSLAVAAGLLPALHVVKYHPAALVSAMAQDSDGYMWFAAGRTLVRFDGDRMQVWELNDEIRLLVADGAGELLLGMGAAPRLHRFHPSGKAIPLTGLVPDQAIKHILRDTTGLLWAATADHLWHDNGQGAQWRLATRSEPVGRPTALWLGPNGEMQVQSSQGWFSLGAGAPRPIPTPPLPSLSSAKRPEVVLRNTPILHATVPQRDLPFNSALFAFIAEDTTVRGVASAIEGTWVATSRRLALVKDGAIRQQWSGEGIENEILAIFLDREQGMWVSLSGRGVIRIEASPVAVPNFEGMEVRGPAFDMAVVNGALWFTSTFGLLRFSPSTGFQQFRPPRDLRAFTMRALVATKDGTVFLGNLESRLLKFDAVAGFSAITLPGAIERERATALVLSGEDQLWVGTSTGRVLTMGVQEQVLRDANLPNEASPLCGPPANEDRCPWSISWLSVAAEGELWVGTNARGIYRWRARNQQQQRVGKLLDGTRINAVFQFGETLLSCTNSGLWAFTNGQEVVLAQSDGLPSNALLGIADDGRQHLWLSSDRGVHRISKQALAVYLRDRFMGTQGQPLAPVSYDHQDHLPSDQVIDRSHASVTLGPDGRIWVATVLGLSVIDPEHATRLDPLPPVTIYGVVADAETSTESMRVTVQPGRGDLAFHYTSPTFDATHRLHFRHRLVGRDPVWSQAQTQRQISYTNLDPGRYFFEVQATKDAGERVSPIASVEVVLLPHFHQTKTFVMLLLGLGLLGLYGAYQARLRQVQARYHAATSERNRIARDLHDSLAQIFTSLGLRIDVLRRTLQGKSSDLPSKAAHVSQAVDELRQVVDHGRLSSRAVIRNLRRERADLLSSLSEVAGFYPGVSVVLVCEQSLPAMSPELESDLLAVGLEAVNNAVAHGKAKHITIEFDAGPPLAMWVRDDGQGFNTGLKADARGGHYGLLGMQERVARHNGKLVVHAEEGVGAEVGVVLAGGRL